MLIRRRHGLKWLRGLPSKLSFPDEEIAPLSFRVVHAVMGNWSLLGSPVRSLQLKSQLLFGWRGTHCTESLLVQVVSWGSYVCFGGGTCWKQSKTKQKKSLVLLFLLLDSSKKLTPLLDSSKKLTPLLDTSKMLTLLTFIGGLLCHLCIHFHLFLDLLSMANHLYPGYTKGKSEILFQSDL